MWNLRYRNIRVKASVTVYRKVGIPHPVLGRSAPAFGWCVAMAITSRLQQEVTLNDKPPETDNLIHFPQTLRVVPIEPAPALPLEHELALIEHDGRLYDLAALVRHLSPAELQVIAAAGPRSSQEMWDHVVRCWPAMAAEIVAGARPAN